MNLKEAFDKYKDDDKYNNEFLKFDKIENKLSTRPDLHAFLMLDKLFPGEMDMIIGAERDRIWLDVNIYEHKDIEKSIIIDLRRCGVICDYEYECLAMFV